MKTAEEVAESVWEYLRDQVMLYQQLGNEKNRDKGIESIAQALTAYAEEHYQELTDEKNALYQWNYNKGVEAGKATFLGRLELARAEALEEAAKICEIESDKCDDHDNAELRVWSLAEKIRSLKVKP